MFSYQLEAAFLSYSVKIGADFHVVGRRCLCKCLSAVSAAATRLQKYHCNLSRSLRWKSAACPAMWIISVSVLGGLYEWALSTAVLLRHKHFLFFWAHDISIRIPMFRTLTNEQVKLDNRKSNTIKGTIIVCSVWSVISFVVSHSTSKFTDEELRRGGGWL